MPTHEMARILNSGLLQTPTLMCETQKPMDILKPFHASAPSLKCVGSRTLEAAI